MAINQLNFAMPRAEPQKQEKQKLSDIEKILQGLQVVQAGFGIASDFTQIGNAMQQRKINDQTMKLREEQIGAAQDERVGIVTPDKLIGRNYREAQGPEANAVGLRTPQGLRYVVVDPLTASEQATIDINKQKSDAAVAQRLEDLEAKDRENLFKVQDKFRTDKTVMEASDKLSRGNVVRGLLAQNRPITDVIALNQLFRLSGDVGAIRDEDLRRLGSSPAIRDQAAQALNMLYNGDRIDKPSRDNIFAAIDLMEEIAKKDINQRADVLAGQGAALIRGMDKDDVLRNLNVESFLPPPQDVPPGGGSLSSSGRINPTYQILPSVTPEAQAAPGGFNPTNNFYNEYLQQFQR